MEKEKTRGVKDRRISPNGPEIIRLRKAKGMSFEDLMGKAPCSRVTLEKVEDGQLVYPFTIKKIATALKVEPETLLVGYVAQGASLVKPKNDNVCVIKVEVSIPFQLFNESSELHGLVELLKKLSGAKDMEPDSTNEGSTVITVRLSEKDAVKLLNAYQTGAFSFMNIWITPISFSVDELPSYTRILEQEAVERAAQNEQWSKKRRQ